MPTRAKTAPNIIIYTITKENTPSRAITRGIRGRLSSSLVR